MLLAVQNCPSDAQPVQPENEVEVAQQHVFLLLFAALVVDPISAAHHYPHSAGATKKLLSQIQAAGSKKGALAQPAAAAAAAAAALHAAIAALGRSRIRWWQLDKDKEKEKKKKKKKRSNFESAMPGLLLGFSAAYTFHYTRIVAARAKVVGAESKRDDAMDRPVVPLSFLLSSLDPLCVSNYRHAGQPAQPSPSSSSVSQSVSQTETYMQTTPKYKGPHRRPALLSQGNSTTRQREGFRPSERPSHSNSAPVHPPPAAIHQPASYRHTFLLSYVLLLTSHEGGRKPVPPLDGPSRHVKLARWIDASCTSPAMRA
ncbi:hypothetical protein IWX46DRAFT_577173 [Phyllosticta citricarpa]|uniref:Uncharacterized protein n=1 Tax=Phyllosticta citricarpa TaxID=55181 RepID=A0ABR1MTM4_9PEZI